MKFLKISALLMVIIGIISGIEGRSESSSTGILASGATSSAFFGGGPSPKSGRGSSFIPSRIGGTAMSSKGFLKDFGGNMAPHGDPVFRQERYFPLGESRERTIAALISNGFQSEKETDDSSDYEYFS